MRLVERLLCLAFPNTDITHGGSLYLRRWLLTPSVFGFRLMLHKIARPDMDRVLHDHPWDFAALCVAGGYDEAVLMPGGEVVIESLRPGGLRFRAYDHTHRIETVIGESAWTLVFHGVRRHVWGFWNTDARPPRFTEAKAYFKVGYDAAAPMQRRWAA